MFENDTFTQNATIVIILALTILISIMAYRSLLKVKKKIPNYNSNLDCQIQKIFEGL